MSEAGLRAASDQAIGDHALAGGFAIVSKDNDFQERSFGGDSQPKVIWLDVGNAGTMAIAKLLRSERSRVDSFGQDETSLLILSLEPAK